MSRVTVGVLPMVVVVGTVAAAGVVAVVVLMTLLLSTLGIVMTVRVMQTATLHRVPNASIS